MLRSAQPRSKVSQSFICWRCLSNAPFGPLERARQKTGARDPQPTPRHKKHTTGLQLGPRREFSAYSTHRSAAVQNTPAAGRDPPPDTAQIRRQIIKRLRAWEAKNAPTFIPPQELPDVPNPGKVYNPPGGEALGSFRVDPNMDGEDESQNGMVFGHDDMLDLGSSRAYLRRGDLVELLSLRHESRELAIFVRELDMEDIGQFYTMSGAWVHHRVQKACFSVPNFVEPQELDSVLPYLPTSAVAATMENKLDDQSPVVPRSVGQPLVNKILNFSKQADEVYMANSIILDNPHSHVAYPDRYRYAALDEIASLLLPETLAKTEDGQFPGPALYAAHRALLTDGMAFKSPFQRTLRAGGNYEIISRNEMANIEFVKELVREYVEGKFASRSGSKAPGSNLLERFVIKAQQRIDRSRKTRPFTPYGTIGQFTKSEDTAKEEKLPNFDSNDMRIIKLIESWAALRTFMLFSPINGIASTILRAVDRYEGAEFLNIITGWTFLQEIGMIAPWENRAAYDLRVPGVGQQLSGGSVETTDGFIADRLKNLRQDWGNLPVYCVDAPDAQEIDDGFSIEAADAPDQYWVHVHIADPGAHIDPTSKVAEYAQTLVESAYMPERVVPMLAKSFVQERLSLGPDRPCLTYSSKLNTDGDLLDYKVVPGIIHNVQFISPSVVEETLLGTIPRKSVFHLVGPDIPPLEVGRRMVESHEISSSDKENLRLFHVLGKALRKQRTARGGILSYRVQAERTISVSHNSPLDSRNGRTVSYDHDPSIKMFADPDSSAELTLSGDNFDIVEPIMILAGEVAARWCSDRGIPTVYRVTPRNEELPDPAEFFVRNVLPILQEGKFDQTVMTHYAHLLGKVQPSTTPGPHVGLGIGMLVRATSPLRRYPDLLLQWQVEAALLEEARLGQSLVGNTRDDFLPFSKAQLDRLLPYIDGKERLIKHGQRLSKKHWITQLMIRGWLYAQEDLPRTYSFVVTNMLQPVAGQPGRVVGLVDHFGTIGTFKTDAWSGTGDIKVDDIFEVAIADINTYDSAVLFEPRRRLDASQKEKLDQDNLMKMRLADSV